MFPNLTPTYLRNNRDINVIFFREFSLQNTRCGPNGKNISFGKFGQVLSRSARTIVPAFSKTVSDILSGSSCKEMLWVNASWIIAFVADILTIRYLSAKNLIRDSVCSSHLSIEPDGTISSRYRPANPIPTSSLWVNIRFRKQAIFERSFWPSEHERNLS